MKDWCYRRGGLSSLLTVWNKKTKSLWTQLALVLHNYYPAPGPYVQWLIDLCTHGVVIIIKAPIIIQLINQMVKKGNFSLQNAICKCKRKRQKLPCWESSNHVGNHNIRRETRHTVCSSRYRLSAEWFFTLTSHYCSGERLILKPLNFGGRWQNCQFPHGGKSQLASPHLLSAGRKSYYFVYIKIWNTLHLAQHLLCCCVVHLQAQSAQNDF